MSCDGTAVPVSLTPLSMMMLCQYIHLLFNRLTVTCSPMDTNVNVQYYRRKGKYDYFKNIYKTECDYESVRGLPKVRILVPMLKIFLTKLNESDC
jgi:hypothetical protein